MTLNLNFGKKGGWKKITGCSQRVGCRCRVAVGNALNNLVQGKGKQQKKEERKSLQA